MLYMRNWVIGLLLLFSGAANAGYVEDSFKAGSTQEMCGWAGNMMMQSIDKRLTGVPLIIKDADERTSPDPQDAIYMWNWKDLDESDKVFHLKFIEFGYGVAERALKSANENGITLEFPKDFQSSYNSFMAACYQMKDNTEDWMKSYLIKTGSTKPLTEEQASDMIMGASNQNLGGRPIGQDTACEILLYDINLILRFINEQQDQQAVLGLAHSSIGKDGFTQERHDRVVTQIKEAYALTTPIADWMEKEYKDCR
jgi:hypothetical protein